MNATRIEPGVAWTASGCGVLYGEALAPLTLVVASSALSQVLGDLAVIYSTPRRFGVFSLWFPRGSGFLNLLLCLVQLVHFCFVCYHVAQPRAASYALFTAWDMYTLFVVRVVNSGIFSTAFSLLTTLFTDQHEEEGADDAQGERRDNAYAVLAHAVLEAGAVRDESFAKSEPLPLDLQEIELAVAHEAQTHTGPDRGAETGAETTGGHDTMQERRALQRPRHGDSRLVEWVHGARAAVLPTRREFVLAPIGALWRATRWVTLATWLTLLPACVTHFIPGVVVFALFVPGSVVLCAASAALVYFIILRRADVVMARHAARVVRAVVAEVDASERQAREDAGDVRDAGPARLPRYALLTPTLFAYLCTRALVVGALGSVVQLLFAAAVHHAVLLFAAPVPLPPDAYWGVTQTWWALLSMRCYVETVAAQALSQVESTRRALALVSYFV